MYAPYNTPTPTETHAGKNIERNKKIRLFYSIHLRWNWKIECADDIDHEMDDHKNCCCSTIIGFEWYGKKVNHNTIARRAAPLYFHQVVINYGNNNDNWINTTAINQSKASIYHTCCCFLAHNFCNGHVLTVKQAVIRFCLA